MRILCVETDHGGVADPAHDLRAAGHEVVRCFDPRHHTYPYEACTALERPGSCPLEQPGGVDVVLDVRSRAHARPTHLEAGVLCALRQRTPLAVVGQLHLNPFVRWTNATSETTTAEDVVAACEAAVARSLEQLGSEIAEVVRSLIADQGRQPGGVTVEVSRDGDDMRVTIRRPESLADLDEAMAIRVHRAIREARISVPRLSLACAPAGEVSPAA